MKNLKYALVAILFVGLLACEKETEIFEENSDPKLELNLQLENLTITEENGSYQSRTSWELERNSAWVGFILSKMLRYNEASSRTIVATQLFGPVESFPISNILGSGGNGTFINEFRTHAAYYINGNFPDPDGEPDKPGFPLGQDPDPIANQDDEPHSSFIQTRGGIPTGPNPDSAEVQAFMDYILLDNCLELYFPYDMDYTGSFSITSVAHPLTTETGNQGSKRNFAIGGVDIGGGGPTSLTEAVQVDNVYVSNNNNIILVRPFVVETTSSCEYDQYSHIDFTDFLN